ncbi:MAG: DUF4837 family protein [Cyclobacteriaceae bacterium]|nr:DUF4837 family protein [Cyclobacteriaceae bacterium]
MNRILLFFFLIIFVIACNTSGKKSEEYLPKSTGKPGDILVLMDSAQWHGPLGEEVRKVFEAEVPGLPREEPMFNIIWVHPSKGLKLLTQIRNMVYVFTLDQHSSGTRALTHQFTPETLERIKSDSSFYFSTAQNEFSRGQEVMYLFGGREEHLIYNLQQNGQKIIDYFNIVERKRVERALFATKTTVGVASFLRKEQQCDIRVPIGYRLAQKENDFVWLRNIEANADRDVFITWKPYESEYQLLPDSLIAWRNSTAKKYLYEDPENPNSYLTTETTVPWNPVRAKQINFNNHFAMELRGLWKTNNHTMGGPFVSYAVIDQPRNLIYYIEGFAYSPGKAQREIMRELDTILWTFRMSDTVSSK